MRDRESLRARSLRARLTGLGLPLAIVAAACAMTQQTEIADKTYCPFMGDALCAKLTVTETPGRLDVASGPPTANLRYVDSSAAWKQYSKVMIHPVMFWAGDDVKRSEEHTSELQSLTNLVCRLLLEKKKNSRVSSP